MRYASNKSQRINLNLLLGLVLLSGLVLPIGQTLLAAPNQANKATTYQDLDKVKTLIKSFLSEQALGLPDRALVTVGEIDPTLKLPACADVKAFLPPGSRAWGKTSVGARCDAPQPWTIYVQASVSIQSRYLVASNPLPQGRVITLTDIHFENGDLTQLPVSILTDTSQALGKTVLLSLPAGTLLKQEMLKSQILVQQGQKVTVSSNGPGFRVTSEGLAMGNAAEGQVVQVRMANQKIISGVVQSGGVVVVGF